MKWSLINNRYGLESFRYIFFFSLPRLPFDFVEHADCQFLYVDKKTLRARTMYNYFLIG